MCNNMGAFAQPTSEKLSPAVDGNKDKDHSQTMCRLETLNPKWDIHQVVPPLIWGGGKKKEEEETVLRTNEDGRLQGNTAFLTQQDHTHINTQKLRQHTQDGHRSGPDGVSAPRGEVGTGSHP